MQGLNKLDEALAAIVAASKLTYDCPQCNLKVQMRFMTDHIEKYCKNKNPLIAKRLRDQYPNLRACHLL